MKLTDTNRFYLKNTGDRFLHLATVQHLLREYMCFVDLRPGPGTPGPRIYIEEITGGQLEFIGDDALAEELTAFLTYHHVLDYSKPLMSDDEWLRRGKTT